jgi:hypothetical protein
MLSLAVVSVFAVGQVARAADEPAEIPVAKLPKLVTKILEVKYPAAELTTATKEVEGEESIFNVVLKYKNFEYEVTITAQGEILETAKILTEKNLPAAVMEALHGKYPNSKVKEAVDVREPGQEIPHTFHVEIETAQSTTVELILDPKGKVLNENAKGKAANENAKPVKK